MKEFLFINFFRDTYWHVLYTFNFFLIEIIVNKKKESKICFKNSLSQNLSIIKTDDILFYLTITALKVS